MGQHQHGAEPPAKVGLPEQVALEEYVEQREQEEHVVFAGPMIGMFPHDVFRLRPQQHDYFLIDAP